MPGQRPDRGRPERDPQPQQAEEAGEVRGARGGHPVPRGLDPRLWPRHVGLQAEEEAHPGLLPEGH